MNIDLHNGLSGNQKTVFIPNVIVAWLDNHSSRATLNHVNSHFTNRDSLVIVQQFCLN
jgi:hypothetical protein